MTDEGEHFRKRPVVISACQMTAEVRRRDKNTWPRWLRAAWDKPSELTGSLFSTRWDRDGMEELLIRTLEGVQLVSLDDWIILGVQDEIYPCKPDIFAATYEPAWATPMRVTHALDPQPQSIFLAGPTPRPSKVADSPTSWRQHALRLLADIGFNGEVIVPECADWETHDRYDDQVKWEWMAIDRATVIAFWVPRHLELMPAFTTNIELGLVAASGRCVFGAPPGSPKNTYPIALCERFRIPTFTQLDDTLRAAVALADRLV